MSCGTEHVPWDTEDIRLAMEHILWGLEHVPTATVNMRYGLWKILHGGLNMLYDPCDVSIAPTTRSVVHCTCIVAHRACFLTWRVTD